MKKVLFFLFIANSALAQTDSTFRLQSTTVTNATEIVTVADSLNQKNKGGAVAGFICLDKVTRNLQLDEVTVIAVRPGSNSPTTFQVISKEELNKNNLGQDLPILLDNTPSVVTTSDAGTGIGYTGIRIRGSDATRVNVTLNGIPVNDAESQNTFWVDLPDVASSVQSIQIQRGVGSSTNGGSAFGGTVSLQTQTPSLKPFGELNVFGGSFAAFKINGKAGTGIHKRTGLFAEASGSWITSDGYIDRASSNLKSWFAQAGYMKNRTLLKFLYFGGREKTYQAWNGVPQDSLKANRTFNDLGTDWGQHFPPYKNQTDNYGQDYFQLLFAQQLPFTYLNLGAFATLGRGYYEEYKVGQAFNDYFPNYDTLGTVTDLVRQKWLRNIFYGGTFAVNYERSNVSLTLGGLYGRYDGKHFGKVIWADLIPALDEDQHYYDGKSHKNDFNVYAKFNYDLLRKVNFYLDLQYRYVGYTTSGIDAGLKAYDVNKNWHFFNPKAGVLAKIKPQLQLYASYAMGNREPNRDDVLAALVTGKEVKPETMHDVEVGYKGVFPYGYVPRATLNVNYFLMQYKDQLVLTGKLNDVGNPLKENVGVSYRTGVEVNGSLSFWSKTYAKHPTENYLQPTKSDSLLDIRIVDPAVIWRKVFSINYSFTYSLNRIKSFDEYIYTYDETYSPVDSLTQIITHKNTGIVFSPGIIASLEFVAEPVQGFEISLMNKAVSKQYLDNTSNEGRKIKPFFYSNLRLSYKLPLKRDDKEIKFTLLFNNIFHRLFESNGYTYSERYAYVDDNNQLQVTPTYTYNYYYPQAGFNVLSGVSLRF